MSIAFWRSYSITALCQSLYEKCADCKDETSCAVRRLMTEVRDNTLIILENNSLADILNNFAK
jgi:DNA-binding IscR family transcriptional regulator